MPCAAQKGSCDDCRWGIGQWKGDAEAGKTTNDKQQEWEDGTQAMSGPDGREQAKHKRKKKH